MYTDERELAVLFKRYEKTLYPYQIVVRGLAISLTPTEAAEIHYLLAPGCHDGSCECFEAGYKDAQEELGARHIP